MSKKGWGDQTDTHKGTLHLYHVVTTTKSNRRLGNVQLNWPKLFQAFSVNFTLIVFYECVHSIIPHQHM